MKPSELKKRLRKDRPMTTVSLRLPEDVVDDLKRIAARLGFPGYQPLVRVYVGQGLRREDSEEPRMSGKATTSPHRTTKTGPVRRRQPMHPGEILREDVLPALRLSVAEAARQLRVPRQTLHRILSGRSAVTPEMAVRLGKRRDTSRPRLRKEEEELRMNEKHLGSDFDDVSGRRLCQNRPKRWPPGASWPTRALRT